MRKTATKVATLTKSMMPSGSSVGMLNNKWILYAVLFISIVDLFNFFSKGDTTAIAIFIVAGFLTTYFSKNMLVVLVIAIAVTHIARYGSASLEGMESEASEASEEEEEEEEDKVESMEDNEEKDSENISSQKKTDELKKIDDSLKTIETLHPDEAIETTKTLIDQAKKVQENMELLGPFLKKSEDATKSLTSAESDTKPLTKSEGFCDYSSAYGSKR
jgi:hypothetical protein